MLDEAAQDENPDVRRAAVEALSLFRREGLRPPLRTIQPGASGEGPYFAVPSARPD